jgi:2-C-methyl-D-erythritol 4-phosphate cytidylyltransferase
MNGIRYIDAQGRLNEETLVVTHDAVRPFVTTRIIDDNIRAASECGACDTVVPATDTIVVSTDGTQISDIPARSQMYQGQTPQSFKAKMLQSLYESLTADEKSVLTDAAKICVMKGQPVRLVEGEVYNIKITYPYDIDVAKSLLKEG